VGLCSYSTQLNSSRFSSFVFRIGLHLLPGARGAGALSGDGWMLSWGGVRGCGALRSTEVGKVIARMRGDCECNCLRQLTSGAQ
jgi:hypothetical protein